MAERRAAYAPESRRQMVELVRAGRTPGELAGEFECSAQAVRNWVRQADRDEDRREDGLTSAECDELRRLRRENRQLREEREILKEAAAWLAFGHRCREMGVRPSTGSAGDCYDNAMAESFFATLECELIDRRSLRTRAEAKMALFDFIEGWYNPHRRHSALGYRSPNDFERVASARDGVPNHPRRRPPDPRERAQSTLAGSRPSPHRRKHSTVHLIGVSPSLASGACGAGDPLR